MSLLPDAANTPPYRRSSPIRLTSILSHISFQALRTPSSDHSSIDRQHVISDALPSGIASFAEVACALFPEAPSGAERFVSSGLTGKILSHTLSRRESTAQSLMDLGRGEAFMRTLNTRGAPTNAHYIEIRRAELPTGRFEANVRMTRSKFARRRGGCGEEGLREKVWNCFNAGSRRSASASREALYFCCWLFSCAVFELSRAFCECC